MTDQIIEARALAESLKKVLEGGPPFCWPASARLIAESALRLAELSAELLPMLHTVAQDNATLVFDAHSQINSMQTNLERLGEGAN